MSKYFCYDPETGFEVYKTAEEAKDAAINALDFYRSEAGADGWPEYTDQIVWGEIKQKTEAFNLRPVGEEEFGFGIFDYTCDYKLEDVK